MKKIFFIILTVLLCSVVFAQQSTFRINYDFNNFDFASTAGDALTNGNYILVGWNTDIIPITATVTEVDNSGNLIWSKRFISSSIAMQINDLKRDVASNTYYACGGTESDDAFMMVLDSTGTPTVSRNFSISQANGAYFNRIIKASDGGYVAVGYVTAYDPDGAGAEDKFNSISYTDADGNSQTEVIGSPLIVKFDASGNYLWHHVMRYYTAATKLTTQRIYNDASFNDVVEVTDGYIAVGSYEVNDAFSATNSDGDDATPDDAIFLKTTTAGVITYHKQIDNPSTSTSQSSKVLSSIKKTAAGLPIIAGEDGSARPVLFMRIANSGGWAAPTWVRRYGVPLYLGPFLIGYVPTIITNFFETYDGNYAAIGQHLAGLSLSQVIMKVNPTTNGLMFAKTYSFNILDAALLPQGSEVADKGFISAGLTFGVANFDMKVLKVDSAGRAPTDCPATDIIPTPDEPSYTYANPYYKNWNVNTVTNNTFTPFITPATPVKTVVCSTTPCVPPETPDASTSLNNICAGTQITISATSSDNDVTYHVYPVASGGTLIGTTPLPVAPSSTTTYYVEAVDTNDLTCVSERDSVTVTVVSVTDPSWSQPAIQCINGSSIDLSTYITGTTGGTFSGPGVSGNNFNPAMAGVGSHTIIYSVGSSCTQTQNHTIEVAALPTVSIAGDTIFCPGDSILLTANASTGSGSITTYQWKLNGSNADTSATYSATQAGDYTVVVSNSNGCSIESTIKTITQFSAPSVNISGDTNWCYNTIYDGFPNIVNVVDTVLLTANVTVGSGSIVNYQWKLDGSNVGTSSSTYYAVSPGDYIVEVMDDNGCSSQSAVHTIVYRQEPSVGITGYGHICTGDTAILVANATPGSGSIVSYQWRDYFDNIGTNSDTFYATLGSWDYNVEVTNSYGCYTNSGPHVLTTAQSPNIFIEGDTNFCSGDSVKLSVEGYPGMHHILEFIWRKDGVFVGKDSSIIDTILFVKQSGNYSVSVTNVSGCDDEAFITIKENQLPSAAVNADDIQCFGYGNGVASVQPSGGSPPYTYNWSTTPVQQSQSINGLDEGVYYVTVTDSNGCVNIDSAAIVEPQALNDSFSVIDVTTLGGSDGAINLIVSGGTLPYSYQWSHGDSVEDVSGLAAGTYVVTITDSNGCSLIDSAVITEPVTGPMCLNVRAFLGGCYNTASGLMRDDLRQNGFLPLSEPYSGMGFTQAGPGGGETVDLSVLANTGDSAIVDWVLIELRDKTNSSNVIATRSVLIQRDGDVVDSNGTSCVVMKGVPFDYYFVSLRHRNHFGVMMADSVYLDDSGVFVDFTTFGGSTYGNNAQDTKGGKRVMWSGNTLIDNAIKYSGANNDRDPILTRIGGAIPTNVILGYYNEDVNMDGVVKYSGSGNDRDIILQNIGGVVPTAVIVEQLP